MRHFLFFTISTLLCATMFTNCGTDASKKQAAEAVQNEAGNTMKFNITDDTFAGFTCVDTATGNVLFYDKLMLNDKEVIDTECSTIRGARYVALALKPGDIVRNGNSVTLNAKIYTEHAVWEYTLENGVLTIIDMDE